MLKNASSKKAAPSTASASTLEMEAAVVEAVASTTRLHLNNPTTTTSESPPAIPKRSTSYDVFRYTKRQESLASAATSEVILPKLSPPTPFADESFVADTLPHLMSKNEALMSKTLPRRMPTGTRLQQGIISDPKKCHSMMPSAEAKMASRGYIFHLNIVASIFLLKIYKEANF